jgi:hypothetical protein
MAKESSRLRVSWRLFKMPTSKIFCPISSSKNSRSIFVYPVYHKDDQDIIKIKAYSRKRVSSLAYKDIMRVREVGKGVWACHPLTQELKIKGIGRSA